jgi:hypothetical protein
MQSNDKQVGGHLQNADEFYQVLQIWASEVGADS